MNTIPSAKFTTDVRVISKRQVTIHRNICSVLGIEIGDRVTFIVDSISIHLVNCAMYALMQLASRTDKR